MAKGKKELELELEKLKMELQMEKDFNRKVLGEDLDTPLEKLRPRWSTEWMQDEVDKCDLINGAVTKVYDQHVFKIDHAKNNVVEIRYHNGKRAKSNPRTYRKVKFILQPEAFFLLLELMKFAEREFDMDQKNVVDKMTGGEGIKIRRVSAGYGKWFLWQKCRYWTGFCVRNDKGVHFAGHPFYDGIYIASKVPLKCWDSWNRTNVFRTKI